MCLGGYFMSVKLYSDSMVFDKNLEPLKVISTEGGISSDKESVEELTEKVLSLEKSDQMLVLMALLDQI